jgi:hypothetical protein
VGQGVGQRRREGGLAEAPATARVRRPAASLGRRENVRLDLSQPKDELRDYERLAATSEASEAFIYVAIDTSDGKALSSCSIVFGQSQKVNSANFAECDASSRLCSLSGVCCKRHTARGRRVKAQDSYLSSF